MQRIGPYSAIGLLIAFKKKQLTLSEEMFDRCFDTVTELLEQCNDERYRLVTPEGEKDAI